MHGRWDSGKADKIPRLKMLKRLFDIISSLTGIVLTGWLILLIVLTVSVSSGQNGIFTQIRIGRNGIPFKIFKIRSIYRRENNFLSRLGKFLRKSKIDELPQLFNVLKGEMSIVGPRPDIPGYYDLLTGDDRKVLQLRPGITGPASLKYANEESLLAGVSDPSDYNDRVIFPDKIRINLDYLQHRSFFLDIKIIFYTIFAKKMGTE